MASASPQFRLTARDHILLRDVWLYRYLTAAQISRLHFGNLKLAQRRVRKLAAAQLVDRFRPDRFGRWTYRLSGDGARIVADDAGLARSAVHPPKRPPASGSYLAHHGLLTEFRIWLREGCIASGDEFGYGFVPAYEEVRERGRRRRRVAIEVSDQRRLLIPDGVFCLERQDGKAALFTVEIDRGTEPVRRRYGSSIEQKLTHYRLAFDHHAEKHYEDLFGWQFSGFRVLCLVPDERRAQAFINLAARVDLAPLVWTATHDLLQERGDLDAHVWRRLPDGPLLALTE